MSARLRDHNRLQIDAPFGGHGGCFELSAAETMARPGAVGSLPGDTGLFRRRRGAAACPDRTGTPGTAIDAVFFAPGLGDPHVVLVSFAGPGPATVYPRSVEELTRLLIGVAAPHLAQSARSGTGARQHHTYLCGTPGAVRPAHQSFAATLPAHAQKGRGADIDRGRLDLSPCALRTLSGDLPALGKGWHGHRRLSDAGGMMRG